MVEPVAGQGAAAFGRERLRSAREAPYTVRLGWGEDGVAALAPISQVLVVVDVITFSTAVAVAVERGATVHPHPWDPDAAAALARRLGGTAAVSRSLVSASNPFSLSPATLDRAAPGAVIVLPSPNGSTLAAAAAKEGCLVLAGSLRNAAAVARLARRRGRVISVIAAGERWSGGAMDPAVEDLVG
ncbi:MAG: 2-phosphosulfolactate phosphatase, partial [Candidatus Dormibacteria bacterium]